MLGDGDHPLIAAALAVTGHHRAVQIAQLDPAIQLDPQAQALPDQVTGNAVAHIAHRHVGIQADHALFPIGRVEATTRQVGQQWSLASQPLSNRLAQFADAAPVGARLAPGLKMGIEIGQVIEAWLSAGQRVVGHIVDHALDFALGLGPARAAGLRHKAVVAAQLPEAAVEVGTAIGPVDDSRFLVVDQHGGSHTAKGLEGLHDGLVGMLGITTRHRDHVQGPGMAQLVDRQVNLLAHPAEHDVALGPVVLELVTGCGLITHGAGTRSELALGADVGPQDRQLASIASLLQMPENHFGIPDALGQQGIDLGFVRVELARPPLGPPGWFTAALERASHRSGVDPQLGGNVLEKNALASSFRYHQIVLSGQHPQSPSRETCKTECRWSEGTSQIAEKGTLQGVANTTPVNEVELLNIARYGTASHVERLVSQYRKVKRIEALEAENQRHRLRELNWYVDDDGSYVFKARLTPEQGERVVRAIESAMDEEFEERKNVSAETSDRPALEPESDPVAQRRADALVRVAEGFLGGATGSKGGERTTIHLHTNSDTLRHDGEGAESRLDTGANVSAETSRRLACDCGVVHWHEDEAGSTLDVGRKTRSIPPAIRRALRRRDQGCRFPGCTAHKYVDAHHIMHWADGGETKMDNLVLLCRHHHRLVHEGGFDVRMTASGPEFTDATGRTIPAVAETRSRGNVIALKVQNRESGLEIGAETTVPLWEGERMD